MKTSTDRKTLIIKTTWSFVISDPELTGEMFYQRLFELDPALRPLFRRIRRAYA
jgi:hemoglobin-like flavoprotein